jgi:cytochrome c-type biogenesis protein CcmF
MAHFGFALLLMALLTATYTQAAAVLGHHRKSPRWVQSSSYGVIAVCALLSAASLALIYGFVTDDYQLKYVQHYSDRSMPLFYKVTSFWGGQDGSLLFWVWILSIWAAVATYRNRLRHREIMPYTTATLMLVVQFFLVTILFAANPFELYLVNIPSDGRGLNPLLQNPYMVTHPPTLYLGYIGWTVPFAFGIGALAHGKLDYRWIQGMRRWCLLSWAFLTVGLTLGGLWAYEELGWGGYWAWDPVENAALIPWLTGTAFIHSIHVQERRQIFKTWNMFLIIVTFELTLLGTMMTRSGVVQSVHAFAQSDIGTFFFCFIVLTSLISIGLILYRMGDLKPERGLESFLSREFVFLINNWILLAAAFFVTFATLFPSLYRFVTEHEVTVGPAFFNLWMVPIGIVLLFLTGVGPLLSWRKSSGATLINQFATPTLMGTVALVALFFGGKVRDWRPLITLSVCAFVAGSIVQEYARGVQARRKNSNEGVMLALITLVQRGRRRYGGYLVHFGMMVMFVGFAGESFKTEKEVSMKPGDRNIIGRYTLELQGVRFENDGQKSMMTADIRVFTNGGATPISTLHPARWAYRRPEEQTTTEVDKYMTVRDDLYMVISGYDKATKATQLQFRLNPLVNFVWLGCSILMMGFAIAIAPEAAMKASPAVAPRWARVLASATTGFLAILSLGFAVLWS